MALMQITKEILEKSVKLVKTYGLDPKRAMDEAYSDELGFGSTDMLTASVLDELHMLGLMLHHTIKR